MHVYRSDSSVYSLTYDFFFSKRFDALGIYFNSNYLLFIYGFDQGNGITCARDLLYCLAFPS
jgi:hypothetical protein